MADIGHSSLDHEVDREPSPASRDRRTSSAHTGLFSKIEKAAIYGALFLVLFCLIAGVVMLVVQSANLYSQGLHIASDAYAQQRATPREMVENIFLLVSAHEIVAFKALALALAATITVIGGLLVLKGVEASYELTGSAQGGSGALRTSSPGLVMITFGCILIAWTLASKSTVAGAGPADAVNVAGPPMSTDAASERMRRLKEKLASPTVQPSTEHHTETSAPREQ